MVAYSLVCMTLYGKSPLTSLEDTLGGTLEDTLDEVDSLEDMGDISLYKIKIGTYYNASMPILLSHD